MPDDLMSGLSKLEVNREKITGAVLSAGAGAAYEIVRAEMVSKIGAGTKYPSRASGELSKSLGVSPLGVDRRGDYNVKLGFREPRSDGEINAKLANILEHGKPGKSSSAKGRASRRRLDGKKKGSAEQAAKPVFKNTGRRIREKAVKAMQDEFEKQIQNL